MRGYLAVHEMHTSLFYNGRMTIAFIIIGAVCIIYGITIMMAASGTPFFAVWYVLGALFLAAAWALHAGFWEGAPLLLKRGIQVVVGLAVAVVVITQGFALSGFSAHGEEDLDYLIVLGAQVHPNGPSNVLRYRLDAACDYLAANPRTICIVSGGQGGNEVTPEAHIMASYLEQHGIAPERIILEDASLNTTQNIENSMKLIDPAHDRVGIVTNNFHVFRGVSIARKKGIVNVCGIAADSLPWFLPNNMLRESFGIAKDFVFGNL